MAIVMTGPDTFRYVEDTPAPSRSKWSDPLEAPPLPKIYANASPVYQLKAQTANAYDYTPEARNKLMETPIEVRYQPEERILERNDPGGYYVHKGPDGSGGNIMVYDVAPRTPYTQSTSVGDYTFPSSGSAVLGHEFGHKWMYEEMPDYLRSKWDEGDWARAIAPDPSRLLSMSPDEPSLPELRSEYYAMGAAAHPSLWREDQKPYYDKYYAGLYNSVIPEWIPRSPRDMPSTSDYLRGMSPVQLAGPDANGRWG